MIGWMVIQKTKSEKISNLMNVGRAATDSKEQSVFLLPFLRNDD